MSNIKDKELLAFSNATNLDWQFVKLRKTTNQFGEETGENKNLRDLLTPESFVREYKDIKTGRKTNIFIYGTTVTVDDKWDARGDVFAYEKTVTFNKQKGIEEMQKKAPVLMNYLEECDKNSKEGNFLKEWEVGKVINN